MLIPDADMYIFFEKGKRGGISFVSNRYSKTNKKYLKSYGPKRESKHIIYLDANNLYGHAMSNFLRTSGFKWIDPKSLTVLAIVPEDVFLKLILNIQKNCENYIMITF